MRARASECRERVMVKGGRLETGVEGRGGAAEHFFSTGSISNVYHPAYNSPEPSKRGK